MILDGLDVLDAAALKPTEIDLREVLETLNASFDSAVTPENGFFGTTLLDKGSGNIEITGKTPEGHTYREYLHDGQVYKRRISLGNHEWASFDYDDNGTEYLKTVQKFSTDGIATIGADLTPNTTVVKGNF